MVEINQTIDDVSADERATFVQAARGEQLVERLSAGPQPVAAPAVVPTPPTSLSSAVIT